MSKLELTQAELEAKIAEAVSAATEALSKKNNDLLKDLKRNERNGKSVDPAEFDRLENALEALQAEYNKASKELKQAQKLAETASKSLESEQAAVRNLLVDNGLTDALTKAGVTNPYHLKAAKALLERQVQLEQDGDKRIAKVGDKALFDAVSEWASGEEGKHFVQAQANSGGGAAGGGRGNGGAGAVKGKIDGSQKERADYFASKYNFSAT